MKNALFVSLAILLFASCQKPVTDKPPGNPPPPQVVIPTQSLNLVTSITINNLSDRIMSLDSFDYNANKMLATFYTWNYDSSQVPVLKDSTIIHFLFHANDSVPYQYTMHFIKDQNNFYSDETHQLSYDNQNRIIKDTLLNPANNNVELNTYSYSDSSVVYNTYRPNANYANQLLLSSTDTNYLNNGNITVDHVFDIYYGYPDSINKTGYYFTKTYSSYSNPFYNPGSAHTVAPLIDNVLAADFISKKMMSSVFEQDIYPGSTFTDTISYDWSVDDKGRIIKGVDNTKNFVYQLRYK